MLVIADQYLTFYAIWCLGVNERLSWIAAVVQIRRKWTVCLIYDVFCLLQKDQVIQDYDIIAIQPTTAKVFQVSLLLCFKLDKQYAIKLMLTCQTLAMLNCRVTFFVHLRFGNYLHVIKLVTWLGITNIWLKLNTNVEECEVRFSSCCNWQAVLGMTLNCIHTEWCPGHDDKLHSHFHCHW